MLDIGTHLLADLKENRIEEYQEIIIRMGQRGIIPEEFATQIKGMPGFRNILVHEYTRLDLKRLYAYLHRLPDFRQFASYIRRYIPKT